MLERIEVIAQEMAGHASRRQFLGKLSRGAMAAAAAVGGLLVTSQSAEAGRRLKCCPKRLRCRPPQKKGCKMIACVEVYGDFPIPLPGCRWDCGGTIIETACGRKGVIVN